MPPKLDLLLINPGSFSSIYSQVGSLACLAPPIGLALIAAFVKSKGFSVEILDAEALNLSPDDVCRFIEAKVPLLVGLTATTSKMTAACEIIEIVKSKNSSIKIIIGGHHAASLPEKTLLETKVDFVCNCEGFHPVTELMQTLKYDYSACEFNIKGLCYRNDKNEVVVNAPAELITNLDELPLTAWELLPMDRYRAHNWHCFGYESRTPYAVIASSLGCPYSCSYCSVNAVYKKHSFRTWSPKRFVEEIEILYKVYKVKHIEIVDDTFTVNKARVHEICDLIIQKGIKINFWAYARTDTVDQALLIKMKQAGINWIAYGFESGNTAVRNSVNKSQSQIMNAVEMTYNAGQNIISNFIFGLPDDNFQTMQDTLDLALQINAEYTNLYCAMAYPGSELYRTAVSNNLKLPEVWHGYSQYAYETLPLATKYISGGEVLKFRDEAFIKYFSNPRYLDKIEKKFGFETRNSIMKMLQKTLKRKYY